MDLKERIQELCRQNNVSMNKVETDLGFGKGYISKLGKSTPNATKIHKLADYFMVSVDYLMTGNEETDTSILSTRNERDIEKTLQSTLDQLDSQDGLIFEIANNSDSDISVSSMMSFEAYCDDYSITQSLSGLLESDKGQLDGDVAAGKKMNGVIAYEVPADWTEIEVTFTPDFWFGDDIVFTVTK